ncbi:MAG TPA: UDP-3-O-(3-hydroxymyristoyl)glucosamine N-acyltransferase [Terriglobales bacterium]|nr:UDP-3-O-(3-hydroxymyristoyl)glucosamine N-acyltransferase [Terriglobales bacterium]
MIRLGELAKLLDCRCDGDAGIEITGFASLEAAHPGDLSYLADRRRAGLAAASRASALIVGVEVPAFPRGSNGGPGFAWLRTGEPAVAAAAAVQLLRPAWRPEAGIHPSASIHPSAVLGPRCHIGAFVAIGSGCRVGADAVIHPHAVLYPDVIAGDRLLMHAHAVVREGTRLGDDIILQPGVVVGGDGFGFARRADGSHAKIPQVGTVEIGDRVELQANACVDRGSLDATRIGPGCKIDNLSQIAHNCQLEENVVLCAQVGLAGSTEVGAGALLAGQVGVAGHCRIGAGAIVTAQSGTHGDLEPGKMYSGSPAFDHAQWLRATAAFSRLGDLQRELRQLRQALHQALERE